jgi:hypothetical protein
LIAADGTEWDRTELQTTYAFGYDEKQGQYTLRSGLLLHGWVPAEVRGKPLSTVRKFKMKRLSPV